MIFLAYIELLLFAICAFTVFYLLVYAIAATGNRTDKYSESRVKHRFAILIPAYQDDDYIPYTVKSFLQQEYPIDCYDIIVHFRPPEAGNKQTAGTISHHPVASQIQEKLKNEICQKLPMSQITRRTITISFNHECGQCSGHQLS